MKTVCTFPNSVDRSNFLISGPWPTSSCSDVGPNDNEFVILSCIPSNIIVKKTIADTILIPVIINDTLYDKSMKFLFDLYQEKNSSASITIMILAIAKLIDKFQ